MASPGPSAPDPEPRAAAAVAMRRLGHALVRHRLPDPELGEIETGLRSLLAEVEACPPRRRPIDLLKWNAFQIPDQEGALLSHFPDCVVSGRDNPLGIGMVARREGAEAVTTVVLGPAFEGAPGRSHGGIVAAVFDDTMGYLVHLLHRPAFTAWLRVDYRAPTPVGVELTYRARLGEVEGRKIRVEAEATHDGAVIATAEALFIEVALERLGLEFGPPPAGGQG